MKRTYLRLGMLALACALFASLAIAQDARETSVMAAARDWLAIADRGDAVGAWKASGKKFQAVIGAERWSEGLKRVREPLGKVEQRASVQTRFDDKFEGAPPGDYAIVIFRTAFEKKALNQETLTLEREADGVWRVIGYTVS